MENLYQLVTYSLMNDRNRFWSFQRDSGNDICCLISCE